MIEEDKPKSWASWPCPIDHHLVFQLSMQSHQETTSNANRIESVFFLSLAILERNQWCNLISSYCHCQKPFCFLGRLPSLQSKVWHRCHSESDSDIAVSMPAAHIFESGPKINHGLDALYDMGVQRWQGFGKEGSGFQVVCQRYACETTGIMEPRKYFPPGSINTNLSPRLYTLDWTDESLFYQIQGIIFFTLGFDLYCLYCSPYRCSMRSSS